MGYGENLASTGIISQYLNTLLLCAAIEQCDTVTVSEERNHERGSMAKTQIDSR